MKENMEEEIKNIEIFMLAQFLDVMDVLEKFDNIEDVKIDIKNRKKIYTDYMKNIDNTNDFLLLNLYNESIDEKINKNSHLYTDTEEHKDMLQEIDKIDEYFLQKLDNEEKLKLEEFKKIIYQHCKFETYLAYKIGLIDGMRTKNKCT